MFSALDSGSQFLYLAFIYCSFVSACFQLFLKTAFEKKSSKLAPDDCYFSYTCLSSRS